MSVKKNYAFVDTIRCIAMIFIVAEHSFYFWQLHLPVNTLNFWVYTSTIQVCKFGTVAFFMLAGFLLGDNFTNYTAWEYLKRRFSGTFKPWVFWSLVYILIMLINLRIKQGIYKDGRFNFWNILHEIKIVYLYTNYWFIINFMICITVLLVFRRYLYTRLLGFILLLFTIFYSVNIYGTWIEPSHTTAIFGFVFFLWLGAQLRKNWVAVANGLQKLPYSLIIGITLLTFAAAVYEMYFLTVINSADPTNTLRFSNILFSLSVFALLLKIQNFKFIHLLNPRETTYGIYLIHFILVVHLLPELFRSFKINIFQLSITGLFIYQVVRFIVVYGLSYLLVTLINRSPFKQIVGR